MFDGKFMSDRFQIRADSLSVSPCSLHVLLHRAFSYSSYSSYDFDQDYKEDPLMNMNTSQACGSVKNLEW